MESKTFKCKECGKDFEITEGEQKFYKDKGWDLPKRCMECRKVRRTARNAKKEDK